MYPDWLTAGLTFPDGGLVEHLTAATELVPEALRNDSGQAAELADCIADGYHHFWMNALHLIGHWADEVGRADELPTEFWVRVAQAAHAVEFPQFVPYCLGKAKGFPHQDPGDLMAAFSTLPSVVEVPEDLRELCLEAADHLHDDDPATSRMGLDELAAHLRDGAYDRLGEPLSELFSDAFDDLFPLVTSQDFPAEHAEHAWAVIGANPFRVVLGDGMFPTTEAHPWWRAL
ncbi:hypothetical protein ABT337_28190 [Saccharopolyspora hirsuta]|uniref:Uncharacterized protein n=1 Tax=Saccharopolyspora hirsuta TaxID=1837 RepID=A0A5M7CD56_SACHI|nr:hypothetical protein [Saccharopolyspora hirsuta]KAA5836335.1 hypothetical protein F1721_08535 [Saccharopolyspora hirsuta]